MSEAWLNFAVFFFVQLIVFVTHAYYEKKLSDVPRILGWGVLTGIVIGLLSDLVYGKSFGLWSYTLGYGALTLIPIAAAVYGLFAAHILLMQQARLRHFFVWTMITMAGYEIINYFFRVWTYKLELPILGLFIFLMVGYFITAVFVAAFWHVFLKHRFLFVDMLIKK